MRIDGYSVLTNKSSLNTLFTDEFGWALSSLQNRGKNEKFGISFEP